MGRVTVRRALSLARRLWCISAAKSRDHCMYHGSSSAACSGGNKYYTDLATRTGTSTRTLRYFLSDLGDSRVILGYPWFAAAQPKINWARGWIAHDQLPIILWSNDAAKAQFLPQQATA